MAPPFRIKALVRFLAEVVDALDMYVRILDVQLLTLRRRRVEPLPNDGIVIRAGLLTPRVDPS